ncbi:hypothetical protein Rsub_00465 [Raphidocelis subcapitata]|uniref:Uncharacterized protein n=1 Tax=Raphidocelis subcapitata TaxID=307507 RepID=A0A2V0NKB8_9CHLO|nr:hypothetical protein Rsub_00465 [Raphidocelis subcapitata]|eukprot:GBF87754.1 hypothetical protein Rsub_00465 [Raphidocelis subcapitata]
MASEQPPVVHSDPVGVPRYPRPLYGDAAQPNGAAAAAAAAGAPPPGYPQPGQAPPLEGAEVDPRGLSNALQHGVNMVRHVEHAADIVRHPIDGTKRAIERRARRHMHQGVDAAARCCTIM